MIQMKGIDALKKICLAAVVVFILVGDIWRKSLIELTKLAKISCKAFNYGAIPDLFLDPRSSKMEQMKGSNLFKNKFFFSKQFVCAVGSIWRKPPFLHLWSSKGIQMKVICTMEIEVLVAAFLSMLVGDMWGKPLIELTKLSSYTIM